MRAVIQRVSRASVTDRNTGHHSAIEGGLVALVGVRKGDTDREAAKLAEKILNLRIFNDSDGKMNLALRDFPAHDVLAVSNFTVYGDTSKSRRPSFVESAAFEEGKVLFQRFLLHLRTQGIQAPTGVFGGDMEVTIINDGPVTVILDVDAPRP